MSQPTDGSSSNPPIDASGNPQGVRRKYRSKNLSAAPLRPIAPRPPPRQVPVNPPPVAARGDSQGPSRAARAARATGQFITQRLTVPLEPANLSLIAARGNSQGPSRAALADRQDIYQQLVFPVPVNLVPVNLAPVNVKQLPFIARGNSQGPSQGPAARATGQVTPGKVVPQKKDSKQNPTTFTVRDLMLQNMTLNDGGDTTFNKENLLHQSEIETRKSNKAAQQQDQTDQMDQMQQDQTDQMDQMQQYQTDQMDQMQQDQTDQMDQMQQYQTDQMDQMQASSSRNQTSPILINISESDSDVEEIDEPMQQPRQGFTTGQRFAGGAQPRRSGAIPTGQQPAPSPFGTGRNPNPAAGAGGRRKKRLADRIISPEICKLAPQVETYKELVELEQMLDEKIMQNKFYYQETLKRSIKIKKKLRIFVSHSFIAGKEPEREGEEGSVPMLELRVEGRLLDEPASAAASSSAAAAAGANLPKRKFSSFFKSILIEFDEDIYGPDNHLVEWNRTPQTSDVDGFRVKRPGDQDVVCTILLMLDHQPKKYRMQAGLAKLLGISLETRPKIIEAFWQYIKANELQSDSDRNLIICDEFLEPLFGCKQMRFEEIPLLIRQLLLPPDPLVIDHLISNEDKNPVCYDIEVELDDPAKMQMSNFIHNYAAMPEIVGLDQKIGELIEQINEVKINHDFLSEFADDPLGFTNRWLQSQSNDLKANPGVLGDFDAERRAEFYHQPEMQEAVFRCIYGKIQQKRVELESMLGT